MVIFFFFFLFSRELGDARQREENGPGRDVRVDVDVVWCWMEWTAGQSDSFLRKSTVESACKIMRVYKESSRRRHDLTGRLVVVVAPPP